MQANLSGAYKMVKTQYFLDKQRCRDGELAFVKPLSERGVLNKPLYYHKTEVK